MKPYNNTNSTENMNQVNNRANTIALPEVFGDLCWDTYGKASAIAFGNIDDHAAQLEALGGVRRSVNYSTLRTGKAKKSDRTDAYYFGKRYAQNPGAYVKRVNNALFDAVWKVCPRIETLAADYKEGDRVRTIYGPGVVINGDNIHKPAKNCVWVQLDGTTYNYGWAGTPHKYVEVSDRDMMLIEAAPTDPEQGDGVQPSQTAQNENAHVIEPVRNHRISTPADEIKSDVLGDTTSDQNRPKPWAVDMTPKEFWRLQSDWDADELPEEDAEFIGHYFHADFGLAGAMTVFVHGYAGNEAHAMVTVYHVDGLSHDKESFVQNVLPIATFFPLLTPERGWQRMTAKEIEERRTSL